MLHRKRMAQRAEAHAAPGGVAHLAVLQMKSRIGKAIEIAGVIVMQMGDDDVPDVVGLDPEARQRIDRIERELAVSRLRLLRIETGIDQDVAAAAADQPDEIIEVRRRGLVRIRHQVIHMRRARRHRRIAEGVDFVGVSHRFHFSWLRAIGRSPQQAIISAKVKPGIRPHCLPDQVGCLPAGTPKALVPAPSIPRQSQRVRGPSDAVICRCRQRLGQTVDRACGAGLIMRFA